MYFLFICIMSSIMLSNAKQMYIDLPSEALALMSEKSTDCIEESGIDSDVFQRVLVWRYDDDEISKKFYFCFFKNIGLSDDTGHFYVEHVVDLYKNSDRKDEILLVAEECNKLQEKTPSDTVYACVQCFAKKTPELLQVKID